VAKTLYVEFEDGNYLDIELVDNNPILERWIELHNKNKEATFKKYLSRRGMYLYHGATPQNDEVRKQAVLEINKAIDDWNNMFPTYPFPYSAFDNMGWEQTNLIHRAFTTAMRTKGCFDLNETREGLVELKYHDHIIDALRDPKYRVFQPVETHDHGYMDKEQHVVYSILERINKWVHVYEDNTQNDTIRKFLEDSAATNDFATEIDKTRYLEVEWDTYNQDGSKSYYVERIPAEYREYCNYDSTDIDVYICKNITGKDYLQCFGEHDDPLEWDIVNMDHINGGFTVDKHRFIYNWLNDDRVKKWFADYNVPYDMRILQPPALGKVRNKDWYTTQWPKVEWDHSRKNTVGNAMLTPQGTVVNTEIH